MDKRYNKKLKSNSQMLRKNMTKEEKHLWYDFIKNLPVTVKRQQIIGKYIVDFYCASANLIIELDGSQHYSKEGIEYDSERSEYLESLGLKIVRYTNREIKYNFENVCNDILRQIGI